MFLYFQSGKRRLLINCANRTYCNNYYFLGGWEDYVSVSAADYDMLLKKCLSNGYEYSE